MMLEFVFLNEVLSLNAQESGTTSWVYDFIVSSMKS